MTKDDINYNQYSCAFVNMKLTIVLFSGDGSDRLKVCCEVCFTATSAVIDDKILVTVKHLKPQFANCSYDPRLTLCSMFILQIVCAHTQF